MVPQVLRSGDRRAPGPETDAIAEAARARGMWVVIGIIERDGGTLYCTALMFFPQGELAGKHRKMMPTAMERTHLGISPGDGTTLPGPRYRALRQARRSHLLGKLHAPSGHDYVPEGHPTLLVRQPSTTVKSGLQRCAISPMKGAVSSCRRASLTDAADYPDAVSIKGKRQRNREPTRPSAGRPCVWRGMRAARRNRPR